MGNSLRRRNIKEHRISAGAIIIRDDKILLVRYGDSSSEFLVGPGGGVNDDTESIIQALEREVMEETGLEIKPSRPLFIEEYLSSRHRHIKIWFLCDVTGGRIEKTPGAIEEGISEAAWYSKADLSGRKVYPAIIMEEDWDSFLTGSFETKYLGFSIADF